MSKIPTILITGGARRIGRQLAETLHEHPANIMIHYRHSSNDAEQLRDQLNANRENSCAIIQADLADASSYQTLVDKTVATFGQLNAVINNASSFYPTPLETVTEDDWQALTTSNLKAPLFIAKHAVAELRKHNGAIINLIDIYAERPLADHPVYCAAKAGLRALTLSMARDLAPDIRVNGVSPGAILWPESGQDDTSQQSILERIPMGRAGEPMDIARTVRFLLFDAPYINGQIIAVDGGRSAMP